MSELTNLDKKILHYLQEDGKISNVALANLIGISPSPCLRRVKQLEKLGYIERYTAILKPRKIGLGIVAYVEIKVPQISGEPIIDLFKEAVLQEPSIISCYVTTGAFDFLLKVVASDIESYSALMQNILLRLPGVQDLRSSFAIETIKNNGTLPFP